MLSSRDERPITCLQTREDEAPSEPHPANDSHCKLCAPPALLSAPGQRRDRGRRGELQRGLSRSRAAQQSFALPGTARSTLKTPSEWTPSAGSHWPLAPACV